MSKLIDVDDYIISFIWLIRSLTILSIPLARSFFPSFLFSQQLFSIFNLLHIKVSDQFSLMEEKKSLDGFLFFFSSSLSLKLRKEVLLFRINYAFDLMFRSRARKRVINPGMTSSLIIIVGKEKRILDSDLTQSIMTCFTSQKRI